MSSSSASYPTTEQVVQAALAHVRNLCKGNGVKAEAVKILRHDVTLHALSAGTYLELKPVPSEKIVGGRITAGNVAASREEAVGKIDDAMRGFASDTAVRSQIAMTLLNRRDKGFGLSGQVIPLDFLKKEFLYHEACSSCHGGGQSSCSKCGGRKTETCIKCSGRTLMTCPVCRGMGMMQGVNCHRCHGQRYVPCDHCHRAGMMQCRTCHGRGVSQCGSCSGQGWKTHIVSLQASALSYFEYDAKSIPQHAAHMIETGADNLAKANKIKIDGRVADEKENAIGASYDVTFPFGEVYFAIGKNEVKTYIFGYKGDLVDFPLVLDKMVQKGVSDLEEAAANVGSVSAKIKSATRYRLIAQGFLYGARTTPEKAARLLLKKYDAGLGSTMALHITTLAEQAMEKITRKPRRQGLVTGLIVNAALVAGYYMTPLRAIMASTLPDSRFDIVFDLLPVIAGGIVTSLCVQWMAAGSVRNAIGHLLPDNKKKSLLAKSGKSGPIGYAMAIGVSFGMMETLIALERTAPGWYTSVRAMILT